MQKCMACAIFRLLLFSQNFYSEISLLDCIDHQWFGSCCRLSDIIIQRTRNIPPCHVLNMLRGREYFQNSTAFIIDFCVKGNQSTKNIRSVHISWDILCDKISVWLEHRRFLLKTPLINISIYPFMPRCSVTKVTHNKESLIIRSSWHMYKTSLDKLFWDCVFHTRWCMYYT